jgi:hypothetical protein
MSAIRPKTARIPAFYDLMPHMAVIMRNRIEAKHGIIRELDPADPRNLNHPSHREQLLELARAMGRAEADYELEQQRTDGKAASRRPLRAVLKREAKS